VRRLVVVLLAALVSGLGLIQTAGAVSFTATIRVAHIYDDQEHPSLVADAGPERCLFGERERESLTTPEPVGHGASARYENPTLGSTTAYITSAGVVLGLLAHPNHPAFVRVQGHEGRLSDIARRAVAAKTAARSAVKTARALLGDVAKIERHLSRLDHSPANDAMIDRLRSAATSERSLTQAEQNFVTHELTEAGLMDQGVGYNAAHAAAGQTHPTFANYDPEVIKQFPELFNQNWRNYCGIT
jgi:hypothetical protein